MDGLKPFQFEQARIPCDEVVRVRLNGSGKNQEIVRVVNGGGDGTGASNKDRRLGQQREEVMNIARREVIATSDFWARESLLEFFQDGRTDGQVKVLGPPRLDDVRRCSTRGDQRTDENIRVENGLRHSDACAVGGLLGLASRLGPHHDARHAPGRSCSWPISDRGRQRADFVFSSTLGTDQRGSSRSPGGLVLRRSRSLFSCEPDRAARETRVGYFLRYKSLPSDVPAHGCSDTECTPGAYENPRKVQSDECCQIGGLIEAQHCEKRMTREIPARPPVWQIWMGDLPGFTSPTTEKRNGDREKKWGQADFCGDDVPRGVGLATAVGAHGGFTLASGRRAVVALQHANGVIEKKRTAT